MGMVWEDIRKSKLVVLLLITGAVYFFLKYLSPLLSPVLTAMLFVTIFGPLLKKIQEKLHIHRQVGAVVLLLAAGLLLLILIWVLISWMVGSLPQWGGELEKLEQELSGLVGSICQWLGNTIRIDSDYLENTILHSLQGGIDYLQNQAIPGVLSQSWQYVKIIAALGGFLITFIIASVLLAKDYDDIMNRMLDREECHLFLEVICGIIRYIATYVKAQGIIMSIIALLCAVSLGVCGIRHGVIWGVLAGVLDALPFIGTGIVLVPLGLTQLFGGFPGRALLCLGLYMLCIFLRECLEPRLIGRRMGVPPIAVLVSVYAGLGLFGISGIIKGPLGFVIIYQTYQSVCRRQEQFSGETKGGRFEVSGTGDDLTGS